MKKILYIDYDLQVGHLNFNHIQFDALRNTGADVRLVLHKFMYERLPYPIQMYDFIIPPILRYRDGHPFINRIVFVLTLLLIRIKVNTKAYDNVIVGYCDEISLSLVKIARNMFIFMHRTATVRDSHITRCLCRRIARDNTFLVMSKHMADILQESGITRYKIVSHGCIKPFTTQPTIEPEHPFRIIHPSAKLNLKFVEQVLQNPKLHEYINTHDIEILIKPCQGIPTIIQPNIKYLPPVIDFEEYKQYFTDADAILLSYPEDFSGQVSGISYECFANLKRILIYRHPALSYCRQYYNYNPVFETTEEFILLLDSLITDPSLQCTAPAKDLTPDYSFLK